MMARLRPAAKPGNFMLTLTSTNMKNPIFILILCLSMFSCQEKNNGPLIGTWQLTEQLIDIGDGKGTFVQSEGGKTIEFRKDGTVVSNGSLCGMGGEAGQNSTGKYSVETGEIISGNCGPGALPVKFQLKGEELILNYPCIEACGEKYRKVR